MLKDLHIHIERGEYKKEWIEKFINKAIEMNIDEINLLEHSIRIKEFHPTFEEAKNYNLYQAKWFAGKEKQAHSLEEYKTLIDEIKSNDYPIKVNFGLEICWFEQHEDYIRDLVADNYFDYLLGSVHWIDNWTFNQRKYQWLGRDVDKIYQRYYEMSNSLISSNIFNIIAHPDLVRCHSIYPSYDLTNTYRELCQNAKANNVMIEINTSKGLGINDCFLNIAREEGVIFSLGSDAHSPENVGKRIREASMLLSNY